MTINQEQMRQFREMIQSDQALQAQLQQAENGAALASVLVQAAAERGLTVSAAELEQGFAAIAQNHGPRALGDGELDAVAGGISKVEFGVASGLSLWIACAIMSYGNEPIDDFRVTPEGYIRAKYGARDLGWC